MGGYVIDPQAPQRTLHFCGVCRGVGTVQDKCPSCGRPAHYTEAAYVANGIYTCGREDCRKKAFEAIEVADKDEDPDDKEDRRLWGGHFMDH